MRPNPIHASDDPEVVRQLLRENPWCTLVSSNAGELVASHYPVLLDETSPELAMLTHVGRPDRGENAHGLGRQEILVIVQGRHGYISPSWYTPGTTPAPTWNFSTAHCYGVPRRSSMPRRTCACSRGSWSISSATSSSRCSWTPSGERGLAKGTGRAAHPHHALRVQDQAQP